VPPLLAFKIARIVRDLISHGDTRPLTGRQDLAPAPVES
jgi:hypothetical protein